MNSYESTSTGSLSRLSFWARITNNFESIMLLMFVLGLAFVVIEAVALTPLHHRLVEAMNPTETIVVDGIEKQHHMTEQEIAESDRTFFWQAIAGGLLVLMLLKMAICTKIVRKQRTAARVVEEAEVKGFGDRELVFDKRQKIFQSFSRHLEYLFRDSLTVQSLMTRDVVSVRPETSREKLSEKMESQSFHHMLVTDDASRLLGVVTRGDLARKSGDAAEELMSKDCISISKDMRIVPAVTLMLERRIDCLPVVDEDRLCGIVTKTDMLLMLQSIVRTCSLPDIESRVNEVFHKRRASKTISNESIANNTIAS